MSSQYANSNIVFIANTPYANANINSLSLQESYLLCATGNLTSSFNYQNCTYSNSDTVTMIPFSNSIPSSILSTCLWNYQQNPISTYNGSFQSYNNPELYLNIPTESGSNVTTTVDPQNMGFNAQYNSDDIDSFTSPLQIVSTNNISNVDFDLNVSFGSCTSNCCPKQIQVTSQTYSSLNTENLMALNPSSYILNDVPNNYYYNVSLTFIIESIQNIIPMAPFIYGVMNLNIQSLLYSYSANTANTATLTINSAILNNIDTPPLTGNYNTYTYTFTVTTVNLYTIAQTSSFSLTIQSNSDTTTSIYLNNVQQPSINLNYVPQNTIYIKK